MKKTLIALLLLSLFLSVSVCTVYADEQIDTIKDDILSDGSVVIMGDDSVEYYPLDAKKVYAKEYSREELELYIRGELASTRVKGDILARCYTEDIEATGKKLFEVLGYTVEYTTIKLETLCLYCFNMDEADMYDAMLSLLEAGFYASVNGVGFAEDEIGGTVPRGEYISYYCGDIDQNYTYNAKDYMMLKRIVLGTYDASEVQCWIADVDGNGVINSKDYMMLKSHVLGNYKITEMINVSDDDGSYLGRSTIP